MNWKAKAVFGQVLSALPGRATLYYLAQRFVTRSLPLPDPDFRIRVEAACWHLANYQRHGRRPLAEATFFEFGAGWDLAVPLMLAWAGVRHQVVVDRDRLARVELLNSSLGRLRALAAADTRLAGCAPLPNPAGLPAAGPHTSADLDAWLSGFRIEYHAPADARATHLQDAACDAVTNTATLEHIPEPVIAEILREMFRILRPGGVLSCEIDPSDHFSHSDPSISPWNFLRYSEGAWRWLNSDMLYQNRLRASAYVALVQAAGFEIIHVETGFPAGMDIERIATPPVHPTAVRCTDRRDLLASSMRLVGRKPGG
ncbi:MAG TPA: methyltransferase domain-containing protein [Candidatus Polarisedimenticolia bacterium]|jgi:SAM-dependent methyltransferase|nr:methyltransferase domain-containing protein [Candidatus Polarisedimenticolia bacterium]